jgi:hypothetical protein
MKVTFSHGTNGLGIATYNTEWHERGGVRLYRSIRVERHFTYTPMMRRQVSVYRIVVTDHDEHGGANVIRPGVGITTFKGALDALGDELREAVALGFASKADMERIPAVR